MNINPTFIDEGWLSETEDERSFLTLPSSQLHAPPQIPKHTDRIERIVGTRTPRSRRRTTTDVLKAERPGNPQLNLFLVVLFLLLFLRFARLECRRVSLRAGCIPFLFCLRRRFGFIDRL